MKSIWSAVLLLIVLSSPSCEDDDDSTINSTLYTSSFNLNIAGSAFEYPTQNNLYNLCEDNPGRSYIYSKRWVNNRVLYRAEIGTQDAISSPGIIGFELYVSWDSSQENDASLIQSLREIQLGNSTRTAKFRMFVRDVNGNDFATYLMANELDVTLEDSTSLDSLSISLIDDPNCGLWDGQIMKVDFAYEGQAYRVDGSDSIYIDNAQIILFAPAKN
jgi:hypothetical protein